MGVWEVANITPKHFARLRKSRVLTVILAGAGASALALGFAGVTVADPTPFVTGPSANSAPTPPGGLNHPIGLAFAGGQLLETDECDDTVLAFNDQGQKSVFARLPTYPPRNPNDPTSACREGYIAAAPPSRPEWQNQVFVIKGQKVYSITPGGQVSLFATVPCTDDQNGVTFDTTGSWGYQLIIECIDGHILSADPQGNLTTRAMVPFGAEGPAVAPASFPTYGGWLIAPDEGDNAIMAVSPQGTYTKIASFPDPEHINFVPSTVCPFGQSGGVYFTANPDSNSSTINKWPSSDFQGLAGQAIVTGENGPVGLLSSPGNISTFNTKWGGTFEGATFTDSSSCPSGSKAPTTQQVYVADNGSGSVSQFGSSNGSASPLSPASVPAGAQPYGIAVSPDGGSVYAVNSGLATISEYNVSAANGTLSPKNPATIAADGDPYAIAITPDGKSAYVANYGTNSVSQYNVDQSTGVLSPKSPATVGTGNRPAALAVTPDGRSLYVLNSRDDTLSQYRIDPTTGNLSPDSPATVSTGDSPEAIAVSPDGKSVYVANTGDGDVEQYNIAGTTETLSPKSPATVPAGSEPDAVAVSPQGSSVYVANYGANTVSQYDVDSSTGVLSPKSQATVPTGQGPAGVAVSADGSSVYVTDQVGNNLSQFSVDPATGALKTGSPATVATGKNPIGVAVLPARPSSSSPNPPAPAYRDQVLSTSGLVSYWRLDESTGTSAADIAGSRNGSYVNGPTLGQAGAIVGDPDTAVGFNGTNQYVNVPYSAALNPNVFSVEAWAKVTGGSGTYRTVLGSRSYPNGYTIYASASNTWELWVGNGSQSMQVLTGGPITSGWHHLVATYDGTTVRFYVDGQLAASAAGAVSVNQSQNLTIGMNDGGSDYPFIGTVDEVAVYKTALSASTVQSHYNAGEGN